MANQNRIRRRAFQVAYIPGGSTTVDLPRGYDYESLLVRIAGNIQVTTAYDAVHFESPTQLIKRIEIIADGKNTIASVPFNTMCNGDFARIRNGVTTGPTSAAIGTYAVSAEGVLDFQTVDGIRPKDSNFRSAGLSLLQMRFTFGNPGDMFYGANGVAQVSGTMNIDVVSSEMVEYADPKTGKVTTPIALKKVSYQDVTISAANANLQIALPVGNLMRGVLIRTEQDGNSFDGILNNVTLASGVDVRLNVPAADLKAINKLDYGQNIQAGYYVADLMSGGAQTGAKLADAWDLTGASEAKLILDVNNPPPNWGYTNAPGVNKITIVTIEYIMVNAA